MESNGRSISLLSLLSEGKSYINSSDLKLFLNKNGFLQDDPRWAEAYEAINLEDKIDEETFNRIFKANIFILTRAIGGDLIIPEFPQFRNEVTRIFEEVRKIDEGKVASYIPQLGRIDPKKFGLSFCTVNGQRFNLGNYSEDFSLQSCSKPILYLIALETLGEEYVHKYVDKEPSGQAFNSMMLSKKNIPYNPMVNGGSIMLCSLLFKDLEASERYEQVIQWIKRLAGGMKPGFSNSVFLSERQTADSNFALAYFMKSKGAFPEGANIIEALEFYFQCCSIEMNCSSMAVLASTLANGGVCPFTNERVISTSTTKSVLSLMFSCGMYDYSGQFAFSVGLPAKSGVSGGILVVVPGICGFAIWSPKLDSHGNSVRGLEFCKKLVNKFNFHNFDNLNNNDDFCKKDPRKSNKLNHQQVMTEFLYACAENDLHTVKRMVVGGVDINTSDYDKRTGLHVAASEGNFEVCQYLLEHGADCTRGDRWNNTPLDDAIKHNFYNIIELINNYKFETNSKNI